MGLGKVIQDKVWIDVRCNEFLHSHALFNFSSSRHFLWGIMKNEFMMILVWNLHNLVWRENSLESELGLIDKLFFTATKTKHEHYVSHNKKKCYRLM